jgi:hypothetical protein
MGSLGKRLVRALLEEQSLAILSEHGLDEYSVFDEAKTALEWVTGFFKKTNKWPTQKQVEENTKIELPDIPEDLSYVCDLIRQRTLGKALDTSLRTVLKQLENREPDEALRLLSDTASRLRLSDTLRAKVESFRERGPERFQEYLDLKHIGGLKGVSTPWKKLDNALHGWVDGTFNVILGMMHSGKTWGCCLVAEHALTLGKNVLFVTMEMSRQRIEKRLDALHYCIPAPDLVRSDVDLFREVRWKQELFNEVSGRGDILLADQNLVKYVDDVASLVSEHKPDLVVIDGGYRFITKRSKGDWESAKAIVAELQTTAESTDVPWIVSSQQGEIGAKSRLENQERAFRVKYAKEWTINPDNVLEMFQNDDLRLLGQMEWHILKVRDDPGEGERKAFRTEWDTSAIRFDQIEDIEDTAGATVSY